MWKLGFFVLSVAIWQTNGMILTSKMSLPGLPGMDFNMLTPTLSNIVQFTTGFGIFNLGTDVQKMVFNLYTDKTNYTREVLTPEKPPTFTNSTWDNTQKTIIVIHGYAEDATGGPLSPTMKVIDAYKEAKRPENIIFVDWRYLARQLDYFTSAENTVKAGMRVAELIITLRNSKFVQNLSDIHIVGFSLGAHVSGIASYYASSLIEGEKIARISGLDPAGPGFAKADLINRLDSSDATFVDAIHTNMGTLITTFGTTFKSGHVDFFPNGGEHQPGCSLPFVGEVVGVCSHIKAPDYYARTILGTQYVGCPCSDWATFEKGSCQCTQGPIMGEFIDQSTTGDYYLTIPLGQ